MTVKIRLRRQGKKNRPFYRMVVIDSRVKREGKYIESVGWYNPLSTKEDNLLSVDIDRVKYWIGKGAQASEKATLLVKRADPNTKQLFAKKAKKKKKPKVVAKKAEDTKEESTEKVAKKKTVKKQATIES